MSFTPIYEKNLDTSLCYIDTIQLNELSVTGHSYSGITLVLDFNNFTTHFDTTGHTYSNVILNNDVYTYTGITDEIHYFEIYDFYSGGTPSIDPLLTGLTEANVISGFTTNILPCTEILAFSGNCCPTQVVKLNLPWVVITNEGGGSDNCSPFIARRTEKGWTLDFIFNRDALPWANSVFFYTGARDEYDPEMYGDNNLSFAFTDDGRIKWSSYRYTGYCDTVSGYTEQYYISTGQTFPLCTNGTSADFNITITFERYNEYTTDCELANEGGWNDLINTGVTSTTGSTIIVDTQIEQLNSKWLNERKKRLGTLKIYHNGRPLQIEVPLSPISNFRNLPVYKVKDFEEIVLSDRGFQPFTHCVGGGVSGSGNLHNSVCCYSIKYASYFEDIMTAQDIRDIYLNTKKSNYSITECWEDCTDSLINIITPTPTSTPTPTPTSTPTPTPTSTPTPTPTETPTPTPSPTPTGTTFDDWYLPLPDELSYMYMNLKSESVGDFTDDNYWSSLEGGSSWAWAYDLTDPSSLSLFGKDELPCRVRASRLFIGTLDEYFIRDIGPAGGLIYFIDDNFDDTYTYHEASPFDQSTGCTWSNIINIGCNTTSDTLNDGIPNTLKIINQIGHTSSAAKLCDDLIIIV